MGHPFEKMRLINAVSPICLNTTRNGRHVSLKNVKQAFVVAQVTVASANAIRVTPYQATAVAGTGTKVFSTANPLPIWFTNGCSSDETLTQATTSYIDHIFSATTGEKQVFFEIPMGYMDLASTFDCIGVTFTAGTTDEVGSAFYLLDMRYGCADTPTVMTD